MVPFAHLHVHSEYSLLDGACRIEGLVERVAELGQTSRLQGQGHPSGDWLRGISGAAFAF